MPILSASRYTGNGPACNPRNLIVTIAAWVSAIMFVATLYFLFHIDPTAKDAKQLALPLLVLWAAVPPVWFWSEYHLIWLTADAATRGSFDEFKHSQEVSRNIWLALLGLIAGLYFKMS